MGRLPGFIIGFYPAVYLAFGVFASHKEAELAVLVLIAGITAFSAFRYTNSVINNLSLPVFALLAMAAISLAWLDRSELTRGVYLLFICTLTVWWVAVPLNYRTREAFVRAFVLGTVSGICIIATIQYTGAFVLRETRFGAIVLTTGAALNPNSLAAQAGLAIVLGVSFRQHARRFSWLLYVICAIALLAAQSRGAFIATYLALFVAFRPTGRVNFVVASVFLVAILGMLLVLGFELGEMRITMIEQWASFSGRLDIWLLITKTFSDWTALLFGHGIGGSWKVLGEAVGGVGHVNIGGDGVPRLHSHNVFIETLLSLGLLGLILILYVGLKVAHRVLSVPESFTRTANASILVYAVVISMVTVPFNHLWVIAIAVVMHVGKSAFGRE